MRTKLAGELGIEYPIFAFTRSREVACAVSRAGGMGVLGAVAHTVEELEEDLDWLEANAGGKPYGVDVVMPASYVGHGDADIDPAKLEAMIPERHKAFLEDMLAAHGIPKLPEDKSAFHGLLAWTEETTRPQVELALSKRCALLANALGPPPADIVDRAHGLGIKVAALTGSPRHAAKHIANGVDILIAQGTEAGGHCGEIATMVLVPEVVDAVGDHPVLAAGGIGTGRQIAASLALGAQGVWTGSIWLGCDEARTSALVKEKLFAASSRDTVRSRAISGKPARQLKTAWSEAWDDPEGPGALPMPLHWMLTAEATTRIHHYAAPGDKSAELVTSPVGQIVGRMRASRPAADVVRDLIREYGEAVRAIPSL